MANPKEMDFFEHLDELRGRVIRCIIYVIVCMGVAWFLKSEIMHIVQLPLHRALERANLTGEVKPVMFGPSVMSGFAIAIQLSLFGGLLFAFPLMALEAWLFVEPALYAHEKKYAYIVLPASIGLFAAGVGLFYLMAPSLFGFLLGFFKTLELEPLLEFPKYIWLLVRMLLCFGIIFQLPLVITFLARVGLVTHRSLLDKWKHAIVVILVAAAIITPTADPVNMSILAGPIILLYLLSVVLAWIFGKPRDDHEPDDEPIEPALPPASDDLSPDDEADDAAEDIDEDESAARTDDDGADEPEDAPEAGDEEDEPEQADDSIDDEGEEGDDAVDQSEDRML